MVANSGRGAVCQFFTRSRLGHRLSRGSLFSPREETRRDATRGRDGSLVSLSHPLYPEVGLEESTRDNPFSPLLTLLSSSPSVSLFRFLSLSLSPFYRSQKQIRGHGSRTVKNWPSVRRRRSLSTHISAGQSCASTFSLASLALTPSAVSPWASIYRKNNFYSSRIASVRATRKTAGNLPGNFSTADTVREVYEKRDVFSPISRAS